VSSSGPEPRTARGARFAYDGLFWRRLARLGAAHGPDWWVRFSPPAFGALAALALPSKRRAVRDNLRRIRGPVGRLRELRDVASTFTTYAGCLAEGLTRGSKNAADPFVELRGKQHIDDALKDGKGVILVTAHTAGWEVLGQVFRDHKGLDVFMVMEAERDENARVLHDEVRRAGGIHVMHVGGDPLSSLPLLHELRRGAAVALQIDRVPSGVRGLPVTLFGLPHEIPEGPMLLAQLTGAAIVPIFCARLGYRRYVAEMSEPLRMTRRPEPTRIIAIAQRLADVLGEFVTRHPTQWFHFGG